MKFLFRKRSRRWSGVDFGAVRPAPLVEAAPAAAGEPVVLLIPRYRDRLLGRWLQPRLRPAKRYLRLPLDARGSFLWPLLDGRRTVAQLAGEFAAAFPADAAQAPERVALYVYQLADNGLVDLELP